MITSRYSQPEVNILGGVHGAFYVAKYDRIRNGIPLEHSPTKNTLDKED